MHNTSHFSLVVLHVTFVKLSISEENLDDAVLEAPAIESSFDDFVWQTEEDTLALGATLTPFTFVNGTVSELAYARAVPQIIFPVTFVDIAAG